LFLVAVLEVEVVLPDLDEGRAVHHYLSGLPEPTGFPANTDHGNDLGKLLETRARSILQLRG
jgi:hypothetical protein